MRSKFRPMMREDAGAFVVGPELLEKGADVGPLAGTNFTAKDLYDVKGLVTGAGNPTVRDEGEPAAANALAVQALLDAGSDLVGTTVTVEFAWSFTGRNPHDGLADNPADPHRVPGGSSAGAAAPVAAGLCDLALGTDTGGSVRVPAAYCNLFGIRPTHGRVDATGVFPLAPSFDTVGWFARTPELLRSAADVLLTAPESRIGVARPSRVTLLTDAFALADAEVRGGLDTLVGAVADQLGGAIIEAQLTDEKTWQRWTSGFRVLQSAEAFAEHGDFYRRHGPSVLGDDVAARFEFASRVTDADRKAANGVRSEVLNRLEELTEGGTCVVLMPAAPTRAPLRNRPETDTAAVSRLLRLTSIASLAGAPSVTVPSRTTTPVGLSLVGAPGSDEMLIDLAAGVHQFLSF